MGGLFTLASIFLIGIFFVYGYLAQLVRNVINGVSQPLPEWDNLGDFFSEGVKLFLVGLLYSLPVILLVGIFIVPAAILSSGDSDFARNLGGGVASCIWCMVFPLGLALAVWMPGALLMVIVSGEFSAGFDFSRIARFIRANAGNYILAFVVWMIARFAAGAGVILLCVGVFFTAFWAFTVAGYAFGQTYRLSSAR